MRTDLRLLVPLGMLLAMAPALAQDEGDEGAAPIEAADASGAMDEAGDAAGGAGEAGDPVAPITPAAPGAVPSIDLGKPAAPIQPEQGDVQTIPSRVGLPAAKIDLDPAVIGVSPGSPPPVLLREGQFVVNRRATLRRVEGAGVVLLVFEPREGQDRADTPMVLQACTTLEIVEQMLERRGQETPLLVSGQVHAYRGFNYLLATVMEPAPPIAPPPPVAPTPDQDSAATMDSAAADSTAVEGGQAPDAAVHPADTIAEEAIVPEEEDDVMAQMMRLRSPVEGGEAAAALEPDASPVDPAAPLIASLADLVPTAAKVKIDRAIIGIGPDAPLPPLLREGAFLVNRRGRLVRSAEGKSLLFVFDADSAKAPELPMVIQPCRLRESMEDLVQERGEMVVFIVSGQVHAYRGANYLLPTMMKLAVDKGNLLN